MELMLSKLVKGAQGYNPDYAHLERTVYVAKVNTHEVERYVIDEDDLDERTHTRSLVWVVERAVDATDDEIKAGLFRAYRAGCSCEHDCCGHWTGGAVEVIKQEDGVWSVKAHYSRNY